jgi:drug/metabolite transporter (DMT)-like permease
MLCWGIGDFLIQRSTRKVGDFETLFVITAFGALVLFPFVYGKLPALFVDDERVALTLLLLASLVIFVAALFEFEALRRGKIAVVEPIWSLEIPTAGLLALFLLGERLTFPQVALIVSLVVGLFLVSFRGKVFSHRHFFERGVSLALIAAITMGAADFLMGWGGRLTDSLLMNFFASAVLALISGLYLVIRGKFGQMLHDLVRHRRLLFPMAIADNVAWVAFVFAMTAAPIGIAVALSESYIIITVILGLAVNRERLEFHQKVGLAAAVAAAVALAAMTA